VSALLTQAIDALRISAMHCFERAMQPVRVCGDEDDVHMVRHQAVGDDLDPEITRVFVQKVQIGGHVTRTMEDPLATIPALSHVMGNPRKHHARSSRHASTLGRPADQRGAD
jgi:hypothetical protein